MKRHRNTSARDSDPQVLLAALRNSHEHARGVFRHGGCYEMYRILRTIWPAAEPWYIDGHVYTSIDGRLYDIDGLWTPNEDERARLEPLHAAKDRPWAWHNRAAERRRGFRERQLGVVTPGLWLQWHMAKSRAKIRLLRAVLPYTMRRRVFRAILKAAEAEQIRVHGNREPL